MSFRARRCWNPRPQCCKIIIFWFDSCWFYFSSQFLNTWKLQLWGECQSIIIGLKAETWEAIINSVIIWEEGYSSIRTACLVTMEEVEATSKVNNTSKVREECLSKCQEVTVEVVEWYSSNNMASPRETKTFRVTSKTVLTITKLWSASFTKVEEIVHMVPDARLPMGAKSCKPVVSNSLVKTMGNKRWICHKIWTSNNSRWWHLSSCTLTRCNTFHTQVLTKTRKDNSRRMDKRANRLWLCNLLQSCLIHRCYSNNSVVSQASRISSSMLKLQDKVSPIRLNSK